MPVETVVPDDVIRVCAGDIIPADARVLTASACTVNEAALTGEPYPVEKIAGTVAGTTAAEAVDGLYRGSLVQTGEAVEFVAQGDREAARLDPQSRRNDDFLHRQSGTLTSAEIQLARGTTPIGRR